MFHRLGILFLMAISLAEGQRVLDVSEPFIGGRDGYNTFRIPAIVQAKDGSLLAFCEGRKNSREDRGDVDLVMKRSEDGGLSWSRLNLLADDGGDAGITMGNPVPVVDSKNGRVHLIFCRNNHLVFHSFSDDNGRTWSDRVDITKGLTKPEWNWYATGPGHGIQLKRGAEAGRIVIPANHRQGKKGVDGGPYGGHLIYSDDGGRTWNLGGIAEEANGIHPNETTAVELPPGPDGGSTVYMNTRNNKGANPAGRARTLSFNGGKTFVAPYKAITDLETPAVQGSVFRWTIPSQDSPKDLVFFTAPRGKARRNLTLWSSTNECETWSPVVTIYAGRSAYSDMVRTPDGKLGILFENGGSKPSDRISFMRLDIR
jgi:sialidase-1